MTKLKFIILISGTLLITACSSYPTERELENKLRVNQAAFDRLVAMFREDANLSEVNSQVAKLSWNTEANIPDERMAEYRNSLEELNLINIRRGERSGNIYLTAWYRSGFLIGGTTISYVHVQSPPSRLVDSIDTVLRSGQDADVFKRINDNWYLHLDIW